MTKLTPWIAQGRVTAVDEKLSSTGHKLTHVKLLTVAGPEDYFLAWNNPEEKTFDTGDVIRAVAMKQRPEPGQFTADQDGLVAPNIFNIANLGKVEIDSKKRSHYEFGEVLTGEVMKNLGNKFCMDWDWAFDRLALEDGSEINVTLPNGHQRVGSFIQGTVKGSVFKENGLELPSPKCLLSAGFGNLGGMPLLTDISRIERPKPVAVSMPKRSDPLPPKPRNLFQRLFG